MKKLILLLCLLPTALLAQNTTVKPDCTIPFSFTTTNSTSNLTCGNNTLGIANWIVAYTSTGFSGISLVVQSAPDSGGTPGSWGTFGGTVLTSVQYPGSSGVNPNTAITSANTGLAGYFPWMRVNLASITGTGKVTGVLYGFLNSTLAKAGGSGGSGGGPTITGNANRIVVSGAGCTNPSTATCNIDIPTNPIFQGVVTAGGFISSEAASGNLQLNGLTSGNVTLSVADIAGTAIVYMWPSTNGTAGQLLSDSGVATCPTLPAGAPTVCHQLAWIAAGGSGTAGGGVLGYSASALTLPTAGTTFLAPIGGALASTTEANVTANAPAAAAISNMYVTLSAAPGAGNTIAFTFRDAGSSTAVTCTISGAVATSCQDTTHNFTPTVGDALSIQVVTTGTVVVAPAVKIIAEYGVTGGGGGTPGGSAGQWQANNAGAFGGLTGTSIIPSAGWTIQNAAVFNNFSTAEIGIYVLDNSSLNWRFISRALPAGSTYTIAATLLCLPVAGSDSQVCDFGLSDGTKFENYEILYQSQANAGANNLRIQQITNVTTPASTAFGPTKGLTTSLTSFCVVEDGTHRTWSHYSNGAWVQDLQEITGTFLTPTAVSVGGASNTNDTGKFLQIDLKYLASSTGTTCP